MKKHNTKSAISFMIALLCASGCIACGSEKDDTVQTGVGETSAPTTEAALETDERDLVSDELSTFDFGGAEFRSVVQKYCVDDIWVGEETGDILSDAVYARNTYVGERFNVVIAEPETGTEGQVRDLVDLSVKAGDDAYDLILGQMESSGGQATDGIYMNWYDIPHLNFEKPWYPKSIIENAASINGKMFMMMSDLLLSSARQTWGLIYDKVFAANYDLPMLYDEVRAGTWTVDRMQEIIRGTYRDLNGNGKKDEADFFGLSLAYNDCMLAAFYYGFDQRFAELNAAGTEIKTVLDTEKGADVTRVMRELLSKNSDVIQCRDKISGMSNNFLAGRSLLAPIQVGELLESFRDYENDFAVLPLPKWDEAQAEYNAVMDAGCSILAVPTTASNTEMIGVIVEAMSAYSWKEVLPTFYDIAFDIKGVRDTESAEMLDIILDNRVIDFAYLYDNWDGWTFQLQKLVKTDKYMSMIQNLSKVVQKHYDKILEGFT